MVPISLMFFCILFNYTVLRDLRDTLVVTAPGAGAEVILFIKTYVSLPAAVIASAIYSVLSNRFALAHPIRL